MITEINHRKDIPNVKGYSFWGVQKDRTVIECEVKQRPNGQYFVDDFTTLIGWLTKPNTSKFH